MRRKRIGLSMKNIKTTEKICNKTKKTLAYLGGIAFTILGIWLLTMDTSTTTYPVWKIKVAGVLSVTFFGGSVFIHDL